MVTKKTTVRSRQPSTMIGPKTTSGEVKRTVLALITEARKKFAKKRESNAYKIGAEAALKAAHDSVKAIPVRTAKEASTMAYLIAGELSDIFQYDPIGVSHPDNNRGKNDAMLWVIQRIPDYESRNMLSQRDMRASMRGFKYR